MEAPRDPAQAERLTNMGAIWGLFRHPAGQPVAVVMMSPEWVALWPVKSLWGAPGGPCWSSPGCCRPGLSLQDCYRESPERSRAAAGQLVRPGGGGMVLVLSLGPPGG